MSDTPVVIVTGASRGLGASVACWLGKAETAVTLIARSEDNLNKTGDDVRRLGGEPLICRLLSGKRARAPCRPVRRTIIGS